MTGRGDTPARVHSNDNRLPAGRLSGDTLELRLEVRMATWLPEADSGPAIEVAAFAEADRAPEIPAPLIRVPAGTIIVASVRNALTDSTLSVHGLVPHPSALDDSLMLRPGESTTVIFGAGEPGTYAYWAGLGTSLHRRDVDPEHEQLAGAFVVDPPGGSPPDRIMVINIWGAPLDSSTYRNALTINGRSWPHTERIGATVGDSVRWRVVNASRRGHPMHLHGFYFRLDGLGNGLADTTLGPAERPMVVTQSLRPFQTMALTWVPERAGNWLFHCHIGFHVVPDTRLDPPPRESHDRMAHDPAVHMAGLVMGIAVRPAPGATEPPRGKARRLHLFVQEATRRGRAPRAMGYVLQRGTRSPARDSIESGSSLLVLTRGEPTDIIVVNRLAEPAAIHWHGIELESYSDGVAGWSGFGDRLAPSIEPGDSFVARLTLPRAGTFIYHTHMNDIEQLTSGLYGGIVVLERGRRFDPRRDHIFVAGWDGDGEPVHLLVNGDSLPPAQALTQPSVERVDVGETRDVEFVAARGTYRLVVGDPNQPKWERVLVAE